MNKKMRQIALWGLTLVLVALLFSIATPAAAATTVAGGEVSGTWTAAGSPYLVDGDITVPAGETLTIEPGVEVIFQSWYKLTVNGVLQAEGTASDPILFTAVDGAPGWLGIRFFDAPAGSRLDHVILERGQASGASPDNMGGAIYAENAAPTIVNSTIRDNFAVRAGGGIALVNSDAILRANLILNNQAGQGGSASGGGIYVANGNPEVTGNVIRGNTVGVAGSYSTPSGLGGGIFAERSDLRLQDNLIVDNVVDSHSNSYGRGGGLYFHYGSPVLVNNTIANNLVDANSAIYPERQGGGFYLYWSNPVIVNSILWNNGPGEIYIEGNGELAIGYSIIDGGQASITNSEDATLTNLGGNSVSAPLFVDSAAGNYALQAGSPAVDAGTAFLEHNGQVIVNLAADQYNGIAPDMGALESGGDTSTNQPPVAVAAASPDSGSAPLAVQFSSADAYDPDGTITAYVWDFGDGSSSTEASPAHTYAAAGSYTATLTVADDEGATHSDTITITVLDGTTITGGEVSGTWRAADSPYRIDGDITVPAGQTLTIDPGVTVLFQGWYKLTVNGVLQADGTAADPILFTAVDGAPGWLGIRFVDAVPGSRLDHVILERGQASGASPDNMGGAIYAENAAPTIVNSTIRDNFAVRAGGGIALVNSDAILRANLILNNQAGQGGSASGGGIYVANGNPEVTGNVIRGNTVGVAGSYSTPSGLGGGIFAERSDLRLQDNLIVDNVVDSHSNSYGRGGGLYFHYGSPVLVNNTIANNLVDANSAIYPERQGGGFYLYWSNPVIVNSILWNNSPGEIYIEGGGELTVAYTDVQGGLASIVNAEGAPINWLDGNLDTDPRFVAAAGDYALQEGSPAVDAGAATFEFGGQLIVDLTSEQYNGTMPDMGALESPYTASLNAPPVAIAAADLNHGTAPLTVHFDGTGSYDPDGAITAYVWDFGDGNSSSEAAPAHTYETAGSYTATLTVTDDAGATSSDSVAVTVEAASQEMHVEALSATRDKDRRWDRGQVMVLIADSAGAPVEGALVSVTYSGPTSGQLTGTTGPDGTVLLQTGWTKRPKENWCFEVTGVTRDGWVYDAAANVATTVCETG